MKSKKEQRNEYKLMKFRKGLFQIINLKNKKVYLQKSEDLDKAFNSDLFKLKAGMHANKDMQTDWNELGSDFFEFEILDELNFNDSATPYQIEKEIQELLELHKTNIKLNGKTLY